MIWFVIGVGSGRAQIAIAEQHYSGSTWSIWECVRKNVSGVWFRKERNVDCYFFHNQPQSMRLKIKQGVAMLKTNYFSRLKNVTSLHITSALKKQQEGKIGYILLWLLGIPIPILFVIFLLRGCD
ncbi:MAG: hypothetical protein ABL863_00075 [Nitrosomonas sp.]|jgi:hypothetical protein